MNTALSSISSILRQSLVALALIMLCFVPTNSKATHLLGGDITWVCNGNGTYTFQLRIFRDCSGPSISTAGQSLRVWDHPTISQIPLTFISQTDISPNCTQVTGGSPEIDCAAGNPNAVEEYIFQSQAIAITGVPPAQGYTFTWDAFSRPACDNLLNAATYGLTLRAVMYAVGGNPSDPCTDSSPQFTSSPLYTVCAGSPFVFQQNAFDPDVDSLVFSFGNPLDQIAGGVYNPPATPISVPYVPGYSVNNPLPDASFNAGNTGATINPSTGNISFTSFTTGKFIIVSKVQSYRNGQLISEVYREFLMVILTCQPNNAPVVVPPFAGGTSWNATFIAGQAINFSLNSVDPELLQDGSPQSNILTATGLQFGNNFTDPANGCLNAPCAVLNSALPLVGTQGTGVIFDWQSTCDHIPPGASSALYTFEFLFSDNFCSIPGYTAGTVSITLVPPPPVAAPELRCADVELNGDVTLTWAPPSDPYNTFVKYEVYNGGTLIGTIASIGTTTFTHVGADAQNGMQTYHVVSYSDCGSMHTMGSDTISTMFLQVNNPANGTAQLTWNPLLTPNLVTSTGYYQIYREFPAGTWTLIDSLPYGTNVYYDTITVCSDSINYKIEIGDQIGCISNSSINGKYFEDILAPYIPVITNVTVDSLTGLAQINWNVNAAGDTQGYIILQNQGGNWVIIDTVLGINNTSFEYLLSQAGLTSESYGIAAFDSCFSGVPPTSNTSAMGTFHSSIFLTNSLNICERSVALSWTPYVNWPNGVLNYSVFASENGSAYTLVGTTTSSTFTHTNVNRGSVYCYLIIAEENITGVKSMSNKSCRFIAQPALPMWNYLQTATVENNSIEIRCFADLAATIQHYRIERTDDLSNPFVEVGTVSPVSNPTSYFDPDADPNSGSYYYRAIVVDSCGDDAGASNNGRTIFLSVDGNDLLAINTLQWNAYEDWDGTIVEYRIYRSINGIFDPAPIATVAPTQLYYEDDVNSFLSSTGEFCYYVEAVESLNSFGIAELSHSNIACTTIDPIVWVPNAFMIGGINEIFKPVLSYVDFNQYQLRIFDRWGEVVFQSNEVNQGWDGKYKNELCREGVYVWHIEFTDGSGEHFEKRGFVTLLKAPAK